MSERVEFRTGVTAGSRMRVAASPARWLGIVLLAAGVSGCETRETVETELYIAELEQRVTELETELSNAHQEVLRLSGNLNTQSAALEASLGELNRRVMDLPTGDPVFAVREVEAAVAVLQQRVGELRGTTAELARYVQP